MPISRDIWRCLGSYTSSGETQMSSTLCVPQRTVTQGQDDQLSRKAILFQFLFLGLSFIGWLTASHRLGSTIHLPSGYILRADSTTSTTCLFSALRYRHDCPSRYLRYMTCSATISLLEKAREALSLWSATMAHYLSWRTVALVLALINLKNLPFSWHVSNHSRTLRSDQIK